VGGAWLLAGLVLYVTYRKTEQKPLLRRVTIPDRALRHEALEPDFGSILVPIFGNKLDDDIVQTAGRLAGETHDDLDPEGAVIEAIWVFELPLSLPLDARLPEAQVRRAREALARAKAVGEEYEGVHVATAIVRARRAGEAIVHEARRRGVEAIVLGAEEPSRVRGGALFGGAGGPLENYLGEITKYVIRKAPCRVILTAPPAARGEEAAGGGPPAAEVRDGGLQAREEGEGAPGVAPAGGRGGGDGRGGDEAPVVGGTGGGGAARVRRRIRLSHARRRPHS
jgi:APA family basic amino acid/polyamine antiporter